VTSSAHRSKQIKSGWHNQADRPNDITLETGPETNGGVSDVRYVCLIALLGQELRAPGAVGAVRLHHVCLRYGPSRREGIPRFLNPRFYRAGGVRSCLIVLSEGRTDRRPKVEQRDPPTADQHPKSPQPPPPTVQINRGAYVKELLKPEFATKPALSPLRP
jgi:hypothetical protein